MATFTFPRIRRSVTLPGLWLAIVALAANAIWLTVVAQTPPASETRLSAMGAPVAARTPYTVVLQETMRDLTGTSVQGTMTIALRRDGAAVVQYEHLAGRAVIQRTIELPTGVSVVIDDVRERRTTTRSRAGASSRARMDAARACVRNDDGEPVFPGQVVGSGEVVAGYDTVEVRSGDSTFWFARGLGCATVKSSTRLSETAFNDKVATVVTPGEPDAALFHVPERYEEVPPSVFHQLEPDSPEAHRMDRAYYERRPPQ